MTDSGVSTIMRVPSAIYDRLQNKRRAEDRET